HDEDARVVVPCGGAVAPGCARDVRALAVGDRQLVPGRVLGRGVVPRGADRWGGVDWRPIGPAPPLPRARLHRAGDRLRCGARAVPEPAVICASRGADPAVDWLRPALRVLRPAARHHPALYVDVVWFALPIFLAHAPGVWIQKLMVVVMTLVPLWIVLWRRAHVGRW